MDTSVTVYNFGVSEYSTYYVTKQGVLVHNAGCGDAVSIIAKEDDVIMFSAKVGDETVEGISNFSVADGVLYLDKLHLQGSSAGKVGRSGLMEIAKDLGRQHNAREVVIQGGRRTTGKYKGQVPSPARITID